MHDEADEAGGHQPANEENEVKCGFSPEKPCLPLSIEGTIIILCMIVAERAKFVKSRVFSESCRNALKKGARWRIIIKCKI